MTYIHICDEYFQSCLDLAASTFLLLLTLAVRDTTVLHSTGVLAWMECRLWNTRSLVWGLFKSSTWNLVALTFERYSTSFLIPLDKFDNFLNCTISIRLRLRKHNIYLVYFANKSPMVNLNFG